MKNPIFGRLFILALHCTAPAFAAPLFATPLKVAIEGAYPPFSELSETGELVGFDVDLAKALCSKMKKKCELKTQDWSGIVPGLEAKKFDLIVSSMSITNKRKEKVRFTEPYYKAPAVFVGQKKASLDPPHFQNPPLSKTIRIGVERSSTFAEYLKSLKSLQVEIVPYDQVATAFADVRVGRLDLLLGQYVVVNNFLKAPENSSLQVKGKPFRDETTMGSGAGIAARKSDASLIKEVNEALSAVQKDGEFEKIRTQYFSSACELDIRQCQ
jgi:ABC-type amino acid transport substrate-binding protein